MSDARKCKSIRGLLLGGHLMRYGPVEVRGFSWSGFQSDDGGSVCALCGRYDFEIRNAIKSAPSNPKGE